MQLPVSSGLPLNCAVETGPNKEAGSGIALPVIVDSKALVEVAVDNVVASLVGTVFDCVCPVPLNGEHPTKAGAVSLTFEHSC